MMMAGCFSKNKTVVAISKKKVVVVAPFIFLSHHDTHKLIKEKNKIQRREQINADSYSINGN